MSSSKLERTRAIHESIERYELLIVGEQAQEPKTVRESIVQSHRVNHYLEQAIQCSKDLVKIYKDEDNSRRNEIASITGQGTSIFSSFYENLREIKEYHRKYPNIEVERLESSLYFTPQLSFTGNESYGRFLDLNEIYNSYVNLSAHIEKIDYVSYLTNFNEFKYDEISRFKIPKYKIYIEQLYEYLISFLKRTQPLFELTNTLDENIKEFEKKWNNGDFTSLNNNNNEGETTTKNKEEKVKEKVKKDVVEGGGEGVEGGENEEKKEDDNNESTTTTTAASSLYCKACKKLFSSENVFNGHLKGKKHITLQEKMDKNAQEAKSTTSMLPYKPIILYEYHISKFGDLLSDQIEETKENTLKKQSRSIKEIEDDLYVDEPILDGLEDDDEPVKLRIANYPVDWSGKPIPYWVYKLNELGIEYKCEICGNQSYWGRKAYERHFQESRHSYGMSCIGIPNTVHFMHVIKIKDAIELYKKIKDQNTTVQFNPDREEEYEDENGDVMSKKTYEMMVKQGLIKKRKA